MSYVKMVAHDLATLRYIILASADTTRESSVVSKDHR